MVDMKKMSISLNKPVYRVLEATADHFDVSVAHVIRKVIERASQDAEYILSLREDKEGDIHATNGRSYSSTSTIPIIDIYPS